MLLSMMSSSQLLIRVGIMVISAMLLMVEYLLRSGTIKDQLLLFVILQVPFSFFEFVSLYLIQFDCQANFS